MSAGLTTYKSDGTLSFNSDTDMTSYQIGTRTTGTSDSSFSFSKSSSQKAWIAVVDVNTNNYDVTDAKVKNFGLLSPRFSITDNGTSATISWEFRYACDVIENGWSSKSERPCANNTFIYGVYV